MAMAESFGRLLQRHRVAAGLSQENLAELAGVSTNAISVLERGLRSAPHTATLDLLIAALRLDGDARVELEKAAKLARAHRTQGQRHDLRSGLADEFLLNNLPPQLTSFVDRKREVAEIKQKLQSHRLVTVVGAGGAGKSRCAIELAADMLGGFGDGVWLAELAPISDPSLVAGIVARTLSVRETPNHPMLDTLLAYLKRKRLLLILDSCEHVIGEVRREVAAILHGCPDVCILATSRESLSIAGEHVFVMPSLPVPSTAELLSPNDMSQYGAVQLFSDRAASADNRFALTVESAPHVAEICRRLDGIPLAIELAAARIKVLSPHDLAQKLNERFRLLTAGDRSALPRHQTMRALIDWSYDLLSDDERRLFRKLSIFAGGFTLQTAAAVSSEGEADEIMVLDLLCSLVDKSLVQSEVVGADARYRLLESTRQYAREKLRDAGEEDMVARAHARAFVMLAEQLDDAYEATPYRAWYAQMEPELENFRAALSWAIGARADVLLGQHLVGAHCRIWYSFGPAEMQRWVQAAQQSVTADTPAAILAALDLAEARSATDFSRHKAALLAAERALARYCELGDPRGIAEAKLFSGQAHIMLGAIASGEAQLLQALEAAQSLGKRKLVVLALQCLGTARSFAGDLAGARQCYREALEAARTVGAERSAATIALNLAELEFRDEAVATALRLIEEALTVFRAFGDTHLAAHARYNMSAYLIALHRYDEARTAARDALTAARDMQWPTGFTLTLQHLAAIAALRPSPDASVIEDRRRAGRLLGYVDARVVELEMLRQYTEQQEYDAMIPALSDALGENELSRLMALGSNLSEDEAVAEAMLI